MPSVAILISNTTKSRDLPTTGVSQQLRGTAAKQETCRPEGPQLGMTARVATSSTIGTYGRVSTD